MLTTLGRTSCPPAPSGPAKTAVPDLFRSESDCRNGVLRALPDEALAELRPSLQRVELKRRQVLYERNVPLRHAYFIEQGAAALHLRVAGRGTLEVGLLGRCDFVGLPLVLSTGRTPHCCIVQVPGSAFRISADDLCRALDDIPRFREVLLGYVQARMVETAQLAACNTCHSLRQRLARCLLMTHDRIDGDEIPLTHQALSRALGVRRAGVTIAMGQMEEAGLLHRGRGRLVIADRAGLKAEACECYRATRSEYQRFVCTPEDSSRIDPGRETACTNLAA
jgi:CRP-like cAMP-binding protein